ncbi:hypothetical protein V3390_09210 [Luteimonas sp. FXH3W]|uniref:Uncharacterized protein n=1 Tax=Aquilutibacter rugosus TaxID=3115820 RepID=A0ABU7V266_9GAMM
MKSIETPNNPLCLVLTDLHGAPQLVAGIYGSAKVRKGPENVAVTSDGVRHPL